MVEGDPNIDHELHRVAEKDDKNKYIGEKFAREQKKRLKNDGAHFEYKDVINEMFQIQSDI